MRSSGWRPPSIPSAGRGCRSRGMKAAPTCEEPTMIAGPNQTDRTLIERYAHHMTSDPKGASELFTEAAELHSSKEGVKLQGKKQIHEHLTSAAKASHRVTAHLPREGDDNFADILTETPG